MTGRERLTYQPALDGLRGIAVGLVVLYHYPWKNRLGAGDPVHGGFLGVDAFFVLSGFLITTLLLQEHAAFGKVGLRRFYARRALRLLPAFAVLWVIALGFHFSRSPSDPLRPETSGLVGALLYVANWVGIYRPGSLGNLAHTFSLAIEEQFYLVWPVILIFLLRKRLRLRTLAALTAAGMLASSAYRAVYWRSHLGHVNLVNFYFAETLRHVPKNAPGSPGRRLAVWTRIYFGSDTRADALLAGCLTAILLFWLLPRLGARARARLGLASWLALGAATLIASRAVVIVSGWLPEWGFLAFALSIAVVISGLVAAPRGWLARGFSLAPLTWLGRRSYAIYLFHQLVYLYCKRSRVHLAPPLSFVFQIAVILVVAELSYRLVEAPMLRRKRHFEPYASSDAPARR